MTQEFRVDEISAPHVLRFSLVRSPWFRTAQLSFTLTPVEQGTRITHEIAITFRFPWSILIPILTLFKRLALTADLDSLRHAIDEGHDLSRGVARKAEIEVNTRFLSGTTMIWASVLVLLAAPLVAQSVDRLEGKSVSIAQTNFKGRSAIQVIAAPEAPNAASYAVVKDASFRDGSIEVDLAGQPAAGAGDGARGFIGIAFRLQADGRYEYIYLKTHQRSG